MRCGSSAAFDHAARNAALAQFDRKSNADGTAADNDDLMSLVHFTDLFGLMR